MFTGDSVGRGAIIVTNGLNGELLFMQLLASIMREYDWPMGVGDGRVRRRGGEETAERSGA